MSDGINKRDWDKVRAIACRIANSSMKDDKSSCHLWKKDLMTCLDNLENKYGILPSLIATRGDFCDNN